MSKKEETTDVVEITKALPISNSFLEELQEDSGIGFEGVSSSDVAIPYYGVLQAMSPQIKRGPQQIVGAKEGDIFNTVTQEVISSDVGIIVIPCVFQKSWVEWTPRESGGGFIQQFPDDSIMAKTKKDEKSNNVLPNGNHIVETAYHYVIRVKDDGCIERAIISMTSTQLRNSRRWMAVQMGLQIHVGNGKMINPPPFSHTYLMKTKLEQKDQWVWSGWDIGQPVLITSQDLYNTAKKFANDIKAGLVKVAPPPTDEAPAPQEPNAKSNETF